MKLKRSCIINYIFLIQLLLFMQLWKQKFSREEWYNPVSMFLLIIIIFLPQFFSFFAFSTTPFSLFSTTPCSASSTTTSTFFFLTFGTKGVITFLLLNSITLQLSFFGLSFVLPENHLLDWFAICFANYPIWLSRLFIEASLFLWITSWLDFISWKLVWVILTKLVMASSKADDFLCCLGDGLGNSRFKVLLLE